MSCWEILGIEPTRDRRAIERAYAQQEKFASGGELETLDAAYRRALEEAGHGTATETGLSSRSASSHRQPGRAPGPASDGPAAGEPEEAVARQELDAREQQIARETVLQVKALLNDSQRIRDINVWRAILTEPPADQPHIRAEIARSLEGSLRPMAENGSFPPDVTLFIGDWFGWSGVSREAGRIANEGQATTDSEDRETLGDLPADKPQLVNFWPAIIGWIVGLVILTSLFSGMGGG